VPVGVFELSHYKLTVLGWSGDMFGWKVKAIGFSAITLRYLVVINAVANG
jgi:hypothetical protein